MGVTLVFFYKIFIGLIPIPSDLIVGAYKPWIDYNWGYPAGVPVQNPKLSDAVSIIYPLKTLAVSLVKKGELPLWNSHMFAGYPLLGSVTTALLFPTMIFYLFLSAPLAWTLQTMIQPLFAMFFMYLFLRHLKLIKLPSILGGLAYGMGGYSLIWMQWNTQATTSIFLPALLLSLDKFLQTKQKKWGVFFALSVSLTILAGYIPVMLLTFYTLIGWYFFRVKKIALNFRLILFALLGVGVTALFLVPVLEMVFYSQRTVEVVNYSDAFLPVQYLLTTLIPNFFGNNATNNFWGAGDYTNVAVFSGIVTFVLAILGCIHFWRKGEIKFSVILIVLCLLVSIQNPVSIFLYKHNLWGGASIGMNRTSFLINFALASLAAFGLSSLSNAKIKISLKPALGVFFFIVLVTLGLFYFKKTGGFGATPEQLSIALRNSLFPLLISGVTFISFLALKFTKVWKERLYEIAPFWFILILLIDLFRFGWRFDTFSTPKFLYPQTPVSQLLQKYPNDRFISEQDIFPANMWVPLGLSSIEGYDSLYPLRTAKLLAVTSSQNINATSQPRWGVIDRYNSALIERTNTRFLLVSKKKDQNGKLQDLGREDLALPQKNYKSIFDNGDVVVLENRKALKRAYLTSEVVRASDSQTLTKLLDRNFPAETTTLTPDFSFNGEKLKDSSANYTELSNTHIKVETNSDQKAFLVVLNSYYPGWQAMVDGIPAKLYRSNYTFQGVMVPAGSHTIDLLYRPAWLKPALLISLGSLMLLCLIGLTPFKKHQI